MNCPRFAALLVLAASLVTPSLVAVAGGAEAQTADGDLAVALQRDGTGNLVLRWVGAVGKRYTIESSNDLCAWADRPGVFNGAGVAIEEIVYPVGSGSELRKFWRVRADGTAPSLSLLQLVNGVLSPTFDPSVTTYEAELADAGATVVVTAAAVDAGSIVRVQNRILASGATTVPIAVRPATMSLTIDVEASDGVTHKTYIVVVRLRGWQLNETNTGLAGAGVDRNTLPVYDGPLVGGIWHEPPSGTVISLKRIDHPLSLKNGNITIDRCWLRPTTLLPAGFIYTFDFNNGNPAPEISTVVDSDIDGTLQSDQAAAGQCAVRGLATVRRTNLFGMGTGIAIFAYGLNKDVSVEQNYVHDLRKYGDPATGSHNESFTVRGFVGASMNISNNRFISKTGNDSGAIFIQPYSDFIDNILVEGNLLETYGWCMPLMTQNYAYGTNLRAIDNRFVPLGYGPGYVQGGPGWALWIDNYYDDPAQPFHRGLAAAEPK